MKPKCKVHFLPFFLFSLLYFNLSAQNLNMLWSRVEIGSSIGSVKIFCQDIDADGKQDIIFNGGQSPGQHVFVANYDGNALDLKWTSRLFTTNQVSAILLANADQDADTEIYLVMQDGSVEVYDGTSRQIIDTYQTNVSNVYAASIADLDNDGHAEIALVSTYKLAVFDLVTEQMDWESDTETGSALVTGDVDGDGALEVVVSSNPWDGSGFVIDGASGAVKWHYLNGFGSTLGLADTNNDGVLEIIGMGGGQVTIFDGALHSPLTQFSPNFDLAAMLVTDIEGDGHMEIITGDGQWGEIRCYNAENQQPLWEINNPDHGVTNIAVGDPDGDGTYEVIWGAGATDSGPDNLFFANLTTLQQEYQTQDLDGPFFFDAADLDGDETTDFVVASATSNSNYDNGHILSYNSNTLALEWDQLLPGYNGIQKMILTQARNDHQFEIVVGGYDGISIYDGASFQLLFEGGQGYSNEIRQADLDSDGKQEIIVADGNGHVTVYGYDGSNFQQLWQSISFPGITALQVADCDADLEPEIIFSQSNGIIQAYDGQTKLLQWQISGASNSLARLAVDDLDNDGVAELIYTESRNLHIYNCQNQQHIADHLNFTPDDILAIEIANLDSTVQKEILLYDTRLKVVNSQTFSVTWQSPALSTNYGNVSLVVKDLFDDQHVDVLVGTLAGAYEFSTVSTIPDIVPPRVVKHFPAKNAEFQGLNTVVKATFSEKIDPASLTAANVVLQDAEGNELASTLSFDTVLLQLSCQPVDLLPASDTIHVVLKGSLTDLSQNTLDGNNNGVGEGSPSDNYAWTFTTGLGVDDVGPVSISVTAVPGECWPGIPVILNAMFSDYSNVATSGVATAEFFVGQVGLSGQGIAFDPVDGSWGGIQEACTGKISTDSFSGGDYTIYVHAQDLNGNWGAMAETTFHVLPESNTNWPMYGQNAQHTNDNINCTLAPPLKLKWTKTYANRKLQPVTYANGYLLAPMYHHTTESNAVLHCLDTISGADVWSYEFGSIFSINPASYAYGKVYLQTCNHTPGTYLSSFDLQTGDLLWQAPFEAQWESYLNPTVADGKIFINGGYYGGIYGFDALTGQQLWYSSLAQYDDWTPAFYNNVAYAFAGGILTAHNAVNGQVLWQKDLAFDWSGYSMNTAPVVDTANHLVFVTSSNYMHAVNFDTHETAWFLNGDMGVTPALHNGKLYVVRSGKLEARNAKTGVLNWIFAGDSQLSYPPAVAGGYVFVSSADHLYAVQRATGTKVWEFAGGGAITLADDLLFLTNPDNVLRAFEYGLSSAAPDLAAADASFSIQPNPVAAQTQIRFTLPYAAQVLVQVTDFSGKIVALVANEFLSSGEHIIQWNPEGLPAGMYSCHLQAGGWNASRKIVVMGRSN